MREAANTSAIAERLVERFPQREALTVGEHRLTYDQLSTLARRVAATLDAHAPSGEGKLTAVFGHRHPSTFGGVLGAGLLRGQSYLQSLMDGLMPLTHEGWMILTRRLMIFFFGLAILNEVIWRSMTEETWVYFKTFGLTAAIFLFFITQGKVFSAHSTEEKKEGD